MDGTAVNARKVGVHCACRSAAAGDDACDETPVRMNGTHFDANPDGVNRDAPAFALQCASRSMIVQVWVSPCQAAKGVQLGPVSSPQH